MAPRVRLYRSCTIERFRAVADPPGVTFLLGQPRGRSVFSRFAMDGVSGARRGLADGPGRAIIQLSLRGRSSIG